MWDHMGLLIDLIYIPVSTRTETELREKFLPDLLWGRREEVIESLCRWITWSVKRVDIETVEPTQTAPAKLTIS